MTTTHNMASLDEEKADTAYVENRSGEHDQADKMSVGKYLSTRFSTLKPPMTTPPNPIKVLGLLSRKDWLFFSVSRTR